MATGTLAMALLLLAAGTDTTEVVPMNNHNFRIPLQPIPADMRARIKELILFSSFDQGVTWHEAAVIPPDKQFFKFYAPTDGMYWFNLCVVDAKGVREPNDIYKAPPLYKVQVDTLKPNVRIVAAERKGDDIQVRWEIQEEHPDLSTLKLEYWTADPPTGIWYSANITPALNGSGSFRFNNPGPVAVRVQLMDQAGNLGSDQAQVAAKVNPPPPAVVQTVATAAPANAGMSAPPPNWGNLAGPSAAPVPSAGAPAALPLESPPVRSTPGLHYERAPVLPQAPPQAPPVPNDPRSYPERSWQSPSGLQQTSGRTVTDNHLAPDSGSVYPPGVRPAGTRWPGGPVILTQTTNSAQVSLDYEINNVGPSGVGSVELYLTRDEGRTWEPYASDEKLKPPMLVNLPGEGVFGLRLVVGSRAGLGRRPPQPGDLPQMRVEVDTTPPLAKLYYPQPDPRRRDALLLTWSAKDNNPLPLNAVTLQWAEKPDSKWETIATDLGNTGRYTWQLGPNLPYRVYLRLTVRDTAGNVAVDETPEPVLIDLHEPEGQLKGISGYTPKP